MDVWVTLLRSLEWMKGIDNLFPTEIEPTNLGTDQLVEGGGGEDMHINVHSIVSFEQRDPSYKATCDVLCAM